MPTLSPGFSGIQLDLFVKTGPVLYDPNPYPIYSINNASAQFQGSGTGYRVSIGHFDARNFTIPSSGGTGAWTITWTVGASSKIETFNVSNPTLTTADSVINIIDRMIDNIRIDIGDFSNDIFPTSLLERYLIKSVMRLNRELGIASGKVRPTGITPGGLGTPARIPAISIDMDARTLFPNNDEIADIIVLQAEILITHAEMAALRRASTVGASSAGSALIVSASGIPTSNSDGIMIRNPDGTIIDTRQRYSTWMASKTQLFLEEAKQREKQLEAALKQIKYSFSASMSKVIY